MLDDFNSGARSRRRHRWSHGLLMAFLLSVGGGSRVSSSAMHSQLDLAVPGLVLASGGQGAEALLLALRQDGPPTLELILADGLDSGTRVAREAELHLGDASDLVARLLSDHPIVMSPPVAERMPETWPDLAERSDADLVAIGEPAIADAFAEPADVALQADVAPDTVEAEAELAAAAPVAWAIGADADPEQIVVGVADARDRSIVPPSLAILEATAPEAVPEAVPEAAPEAADPPIATATPAPSPRRLAALTYHIEPGDTLGAIAARFGVNVETVRQANNLGPDGVVRIGQQLRVPTRDGPLHVVAPGETVSEIAVRYGVAPDTVAEANDLEANLIQVGQSLVIPGGVRRPLPTPSPAAQAPSRVEAPAPRPTATPTPAVVQAPAAQQVQAARVAPPAAPPVARSSARTTHPPAAPAPRQAVPSFPGGSLSWPVTGMITQRFGENGHNGIDIAQATGAQVRAAAGGTVTIAAKLNYGYGWRIVVEHGSGYSTLYAHLSVISVASGAKVAKGQVIGAVGSTGQSTGPHLHFEVALNGRVIDPQRFLP